MLFRLFWNTIILNNFKILVYFYILYIFLNTNLYGKSVRKFFNSKLVYFPYFYHISQFIIVQIHLFQLILHKVYARACSLTCINPKLIGTWLEDRKTLMFVVKDNWHRNFEAVRQTTHTLQVNLYIITQLPVFKWWRT